MPKNTQTTKLERLTQKRDDLLADIAVLNKLLITKVDHYTWQSDENKLTMIPVGADNYNVNAFKPLVEDALIELKSTFKKVSYDYQRELELAQDDAKQIDLHDDKKTKLRTVNQEQVYTDEIKAIDSDINALIQWSKDQTPLIVSSQTIYKIGYRDDLTNTQLNRLVNQLVDTLRSYKKSYLPFSKTQQKLNDIQNAENPIELVPGFLTLTSTQIGFPNIILRGSLFQPFKSSDSRNTQTVAKWGSERTGRIEILKYTGPTLLTNDLDTLLTVIAIIKNIRNYGKDNTLKIDRYRTCSIQNIYNDSTGHVEIIRLMISASHFHDTLKTGDLSKRTKSTSQQRKSIHRSLQNLSSGILNYTYKRVLPIPDDDGNPQWHSTKATGWKLLTLVEDTKSSQVSQLTIDINTSIIKILATSGYAMLELQLRSRLRTQRVKHLDLTLWLSAFSCSHKANKEHTISIDRLINITSATGIMREKGRFIRDLKVCAQNLVDNNLYKSYQIDSNSYGQPIFSFTTNKIQN